MSKRRVVPQSGVTRRGLLVGAGLIAAPFIVRSRSSPVQSITVPPDRTFPRDDLLISPEALLQRIVVDRQPIRLLDATDLATFRESHLPGAIHVWWQDTMELNTPYYGTVLKPDDGDADQGRRRRLLERLAIDPAEGVVVCGDTTNMPAARVCWFLRFLGIKAAVLDGGRAGWLGIDGPLTDEAPDVAESSISGITPRQDFYLSVSSIAERMAEGGSQLIDLREPIEKEDGPYRELRIPGAVMLPRSTFVNGTGLIRPAAELSQISAAAGIDLTAELMLIGPTGLDASLPWLALSLVGADPVIIADGGWQEWIDESQLPLSSQANLSPALPVRTG
jgi:thiosulfate/3-mercaptopyruvate sulfurtransferase